MPSNYNVKVNNKTEISFSEKKMNSLDVVSVGQTKFHVIQNNKPFQAEIVQSNFLSRKYSVKVNNNTYEIEIQNELDALINEMGFEIGASKKVNNIKSPMPGLVLEINIKVGDEVKENQSLLILEAMKMENSISSPRDGIIKSITVKKGDAIDKGIVLIEFED